MEIMVKRIPAENVKCNYARVYSAIDVMLCIHHRSLNKMNRISLHLYMLQRAKVIVVILFHYSMHFCFKLDVILFTCVFETYKYWTVCVLYVTF